MDWTTYEKDGRTQPDENRRIRFREGWNYAASGDEYKSEAPLKTLHWENLGYRLGRIFGETPPELMDTMFDWCADHYNERGSLK